MVAESKFPIHPEVFFKLFFSDDSFDFCETFHKKCGDKNFQCDRWYKNEQSGYTREVSFQHPIKLYLGARFARCREIQKLHVYKNSHMVVEVTQLMNDAPFSDYFTVESLWDLECNENEENTCLLRVHMNVAFSKKTMFRGKIEQATAEECREAYTTWINCAHELLKDKNLKVLEGTERTAEESIRHETGRAKRSLPHELEDDSNEVRSPRFKRSREDADRSSVVSILTESFNSAYDYLRNQNFKWLSVASFVAVLLICQLVVIFLLMRGSRSTVHGEGFYSTGIGSHKAEAVSWLERRLHFLKEEMLMVESRLDNMRNEYASLKAQLQRIERLWPKE